MSVKRRPQDTVSVCHDYEDFSEAKRSMHKKHKKTCILECQNESLLYAKCSSNSERMEANEEQKAL